jgi:hypothetical protein
MDKVLRFLSEYTPPPTPRGATLPPIPSEIPPGYDYTQTPFSIPSTLPPGVEIPKFNFNFTDINAQLGASAAALATMILILTWIAHCMSCTPCVVKKDTRHRNRARRSLTPFSSG